MREQLEQRVAGIAGFRGWTQADKVRFFAWCLHVDGNRKRFTTSDVGGCFDTLHLARPGNLSQAIANLVSASEILKDRQGLFLERGVREALDKKYGARPISVHVEQSLIGLPAKVSDPDQRVFLEETLRCYRVGAYRATIVMTWILAYDHFCRFLFNNHLQKFNTQWQVSLPGHHAKARVQSIAKLDDFAELKEHEVIKVAKSAAIISADVARILDEKLGKRNSAAHATQVEFTQVQAEAFVDDLVRNVIVALK